MTINLNVSWGDHVIGEIIDGDIVVPSGDDTSNETIKE